jgi:hypothetical protein
MSMPRVRIRARSKWTIWTKPPDKGFALKFRRGGIRKGAALFG